MAVKHIDNPKNLDRHGVELGNGFDEFTATELVF